MARISKAKVSNDGSILTFAFAHGEELSCDVAELPTNMKNHGLLHGIKQKLSDSYAGLKTPEEAMEAVGALWAALLEDKWTTRVPGEGGGARVTQLAQALANATGREIEECVERIGEMSDEQKKQLAANPEIKLEVAKIQAAKAAKAAEDAQANQDSDTPSIADILDGNTEEAAA